MSYLIAINDISKVQEFSSFISILFLFMSTIHFRVQHVHSLKQFYGSVVSEQDFLLHRI